MGAVVAWGSGKAPACICGPGPAAVPTLARGDAGGGVGSHIHPC